MILIKSMNNFFKAIMLIILIAACQANPRDEVESNVEDISNFLLDLISKYDKSGIFHFI